MIGNVTAKDDDGPQPLYFYIPDAPTRAYIELRNRRGDETTGVTYDFVLVKKLERDYVSNQFINPSFMKYMI